MNDSAFKDCAIVVYQYPTGDLSWSRASKPLPATARLLFVQNAEGAGMFLNDTCRDYRSGSSEKSTRTLGEVITEATEVTRGEIMVELRDEYARSYGSDPAVHEVIINGGCLQVTIDLDYPEPELPREFKGARVLVNALQEFDMTEMGG